MRKNLLFAFVLTFIVGGGYITLQLHLNSQDTTLSSYLSGVMVNALGMGGGQNQLIRVNLHNHSLTLFEDGKVYMQAAIAATGNPGNSTATPVGNFHILSKEVVHKNYQGVIMPLAMRFFGGYYFHDIPLSKNGVVINTPFSHGCIRLMTPIVEQVYSWTKVGAKVEIYRAQLVRSADASTIYYLTEDGHRQPIANEQAFASHGYQWKDIVTIPSAELEGLALGTTLY